MNPEQKQIATWAGGAAVLVIIGWIYLAVRGGTVDALRTEVDAAYARYTEHYQSESEGRMTADQALALLERQREEQSRELSQVEAVSVWPGNGVGAPPEFAGFRFGDLASGAIDYASAIDKVSRVVSRLRRRAESLDVAIPDRLPLEGEGELSTGDPAERSLQMAQVCTYAALIDLVLDAGGKRITTVDSDTIAWADTTGAYAIVPMSAVLTASYASFDDLLRRLNEASNGLALDRVSVDYDESGDFRVQLGVTLTIRMREAWTLGERGTGPAATATTPRRSGGRGRGGRR